MNKDELLEAIFQAETAEEADKLAVQAQALPPTEYREVLGASQARKAAIAKRAPQGSLDETIDQEGKAIATDVREGAAKAVSVEVKDASAIYHVPPHFILMFDDKPYVTKEGMLWKLREYGYDAVQVEIQEDDKGGYEAEARIHPKLIREDYALLSKIAETRPEDLIKVMEQLQRPTIGHATANKANLKPKQLKWAREMAETRAILRAARVYTGMGLSAPPEEEGA